MKMKREFLEKAIESNYLDCFVSGFPDNIFDVLHRDYNVLIKKVKDKLAKMIEEDDEDHKSTNHNSMKEDEGISRL